MKITVVSVAACAALLLVAGCANDSAPDAAASGASEHLGPLGVYFEKVSGGYDEQDNERLMRESEEASAACMREQGFEYTPQDVSQPTTVVTEDESSQYGTEEFAAKNGYGVTTGQEVSDGSEQEYVDANADYVAGMSETERAAYEAALYGTPPAVDEADPEAMPEYNWEDAGCMGKAQHDVYETGAYAAFSDPAFVSLQEELNAIYEGMADNPELAVIDGEWSSCMADAGHDFATPQDANTSISDKANELYSTSTSADGTGAPDEAALADLRKVEIDTAVADAKCQKSVGYQKKAQQVQFAMEQDFVDSHKAELDAWAESYSQGAK